jgi:ABC-type spermidine/putrescine transport system permease subunit II
MEQITQLDRSSRITVEKRIKYKHKYKATLRIAVVATIVATLVSFMLGWMMWSNTKLTKQLEAKDIKVILPNAQYHK